MTHRTVDSAIRRWGVSEEQMLAALSDLTWPERNKEIVRRVVADRETLQQVGDALGLSRERVRQLCHVGTRKAGEHIEHQERLREDWEGAPISRRTRLTLARAGLHDVTLLRRHVSKHGLWVLGEIYGFGATSMAEVYPLIAAMEEA